MELLHIIHLTRAEFIGQEHYYMKYKYIKTSNGTMEDEILAKCSNSRINLENKHKI